MTQTDGPRSTSRTPPRSLPSLSFGLFGIPVSIEAGFLITVVFLAAIGRREGLLILEWVAVVVASVLVHELGHAVAFRTFGVKPSIVLTWMFGLTYGGALPPWRDVLVSLAGPVAGFGVGLGALVAKAAIPQLDPQIRLVLDDLVFANLAWGAINLLPILPLDGGNIAASVLKGVGRRDPRRDAVIVSLVAAILLAVVAVAISYPWLAVLVVWFSASNYEEWRAFRERPKRERLEKAARRLMYGEPDEAIADIEAIERGAKSREIVPGRRRSAGRALLAAGRPREAEGVLHRVTDGRTIDALRTALDFAAGDGPDGVIGDLEQDDAGLALAGIARTIVESNRLDDVLDGASHLEPVRAARFLAGLQVGLHFGRHPEEAIRVGDLIEARGGTASSAWFIAADHAARGARDEALRWLDTAAERGFGGPSLLDAEPAIAGLTSAPGFAAIRERIAANEADWTVPPNEPYFRTTRAAESGA